MSKNSDNKPFFLRHNTGFSLARPEDDLLHPESFKNVRVDSATETQYFGFSVPEEKIHGFSYLWHHPNLKVCTGGLFVFRGVKPTNLHAELCDFWTFMSDAALKNDLHDYRLDNGYGVKIIEPLKLFNMTYDDPVAENSVDLMIEGVQPAILFDDGVHLEQTMRVKGKLVLRGAHYDVDCFNIRDRSWGKPRPEAQLHMPPPSWICATYSKDFAFNCTIFDQVSNNPGPYAVADDQAMMGGWVYRDGKLGRVVTASKRVIRGPKSIVCAAIELQITDEHDRHFDMRATVVASCPFTTWHNNLCSINLMRWECDGEVGYGDTQESFWTSFLLSQP